MSFPLQRDRTSFHDASYLIEQWWNEKARPYDLSITPATITLQDNRDRFKIDFARDNHAFALSMEEPDSGVEDRTWVVDIALTNVGSTLDFGLRASYRQPVGQVQIPEPRAPRFLRSIVEEIGGLDVWPLESTAQTIDTDTLSHFTRLVLDKRRILPIIVVSENERFIGDSETLSVDPITDSDKIAKLLAGTAQVFRLTAAASYDLTRTWGKELSVFRGAVRCYSRNFSLLDDKFNHRLWLPESISRADAARRDGFFNTVSKHVFTQITAYFESQPLQTSSSIRRRLSEAALSASTAEQLSPTEKPTDSVESLRRATPLQSTPTLIASKRLEERITNLEKDLHEKTEKNSQQEKTIVKLEADLEQERAGRAESEQNLADQKQWCEIYKEENDRLQNRESNLHGTPRTDEIEPVRNLWLRFRELYEQIEQFSITFKRLSSENDALQSISSELEESKRKVANLNATVNSLKRKDQDTSANEALPPITPDVLAELLPVIVHGSFDLEVILRSIANLFPDRVVILDSAYESARASADFQYCSQAFDLIWKLVTVYWSEIEERGDVEARKCFGKSYAAKDKSTLSKEGRAKRTFVYHGEPLLMEKHLRIGTADNSSDTFRLHFEWIADESRIVIGHCGCHLDF